MKLVGKHIDHRTHEGRVTLVAEEAEDMWHAYNLIQHGDLVRSSTIR
jgi:protein pelota